MSFLGNIGSFYMVFLIILLIVGLGMLIMSLIKYMFKPTNKKQINNEGGNFMQNNSWLKLALFSFIGIIISVIVLGFLSPNSVTGNGMLGMQQGTSGTMGSMSNMGGMNNTSMGIMPMQYTPSSSMGSMDSTIIMNNFYQMQMQINQIQIQMTQLQQMMGSMNGTQMQSMPSGGASSMGGMSGGSGASTTTTTPAGSGSSSMSMPMM